MLNEYGSINSDWNRMSDLKSDTNYSNNYDEIFEKNDLKPNK